MWEEEYGRAKAWLAQSDESARAIFDELRLWVACEAQDGSGTCQGGVVALGVVLQTLAKRDNWWLPAYKWPRWAEEANRRAREAGEGVVRGISGETSL